MMWSLLYSAVRIFEVCLKRMHLNYTITFFRLNCQISELPTCLLELEDDVKCTLQCSNDFRSYLKKMDLKYTITFFRLNLQISELLSCLLKLPDECEVRFAFQKGNSKVVWKEWGLKYTITLFRLNLQISELPSCFLELQGECEERFALQWGLSKGVWKECISNTLLHFSDWISRFLRFLLALWNYKKNVKSDLHCS